ncbi:MAG: NAD-dependent epimerase/dehydratase family protein [Weeksellaceae bacterium]
MKKILVTGAFGLVGTELVAELQKMHGKENIVALGNKRIPENFDGIVEQTDVRDAAKLEELITKYDVDTVYHLAGLLSVGGEKNPDLAWDVNANGLKLVLDLAVKHKLKVFWPSSIAAFGPTTPKQNTPQHTVLEPSTIYGVTKVAGELMCQYYNQRYGVDVRSLRYPGLNGWKADPGDGTTEYAIHIYYAALTDKHYVLPLKDDTVLPMMYMDDAIKGTIQIMQAPAEKITVRMGYNFSAINFAPKDIVASIQKKIPDFTVVYQPNHTQAIADSWPKTIDDSDARRDWGWEHEFDLDRMTEVMLENIQKYKLHK